MGNSYPEWFHRPAWLLVLLQQLFILPLLLGFYFFVWQENQYEVDTLQNNITEQQHSTRLSQQKLAELPPLSDIQQKILRATAELGQDIQTLPKHTTVLKRLNSPLIHSGSQLLEWKTHKENNQVFWHIMLSLNYVQFLHFLDEIQQLQPPLLITHLSITPADDWLTVRMVLSDIPLPEITHPNRIKPDPVHEEKS